jgi:hypothetical protein
VAVRGKNALAKKEIAMKGLNRHENDKELSLRSGSALPVKGGGSVGHQINLREISFDPKSPQLTTTWFTYRPTIITLNTYPNGVTLSVHRNAERDQSQNDKFEKESKFSPSQFHLRLKDTREYLLPQGRYTMIKENMAESLERQLRNLRDQKHLADAVLYFGMTTDPFFGFPRKFEVTLKCIELLEKYQPGFLVVQSRSPMLLAALPLFKQFGEKAVAVIPLESPVERTIQLFTPGQSPVAERLITADGLRKQGVKVNLQVSPVLPYGDFYRDAWPFAETLAEHGDYVTFGCLATGQVADEPSLKGLPIAHNLSAEKMFRWLRPHAYRYLFHAVQEVAPEKLLLPVTQEAKLSQMSLFAA